MPRKMSQPSAKAALESSGEVVESSRITHEAYDPESERILVRFSEGVEWCYEACPRMFGRLSRHLSSHAVSSFIRFSITSRIIASRAERLRP